METTNRGVVVCARHEDLPFGLGELGPGSPGFVEEIRVSRHRYLGAANHST